MQPDTHAYTHARAHTTTRMLQLSDLPPELIHIVAERYVARERASDLLKRGPWVVQLLIGRELCGPNGLGYRLVADRFGISNVLRPGHPFHQSCSYEQLLERFRSQSRVDLDVDSDALNKLLDGVPCTSKLLHSACRLGQTLIVEACLATRPDIRSMFFFRNPRKHCLASDVLLSDIIADAGYYPFARSIIERLLQEPTVDVDQKDVHKGKTPLMYAAMRGVEEIAVALLEHGADVHATDRGNRTAIEMAVNCHNFGTRNVLAAWAAMAARDSD